MIAVASGVPDGLDAGVVEFLDGCRDVVLFCRDGAGRPIGYPMRTVTCAADVLTFTTYRKSAKVRNLERDPRACVLAQRDDGGSARRVRWVSVEGTARIVAPSAEEIQRAFGPEVAAEGRVPAGMRDLVAQRLREGKRVLVEVHNLQCSGIAAGTAG